MENPSFKRSNAVPLCLPLIPDGIADAKKSTVTGVIFFGFSTVFVGEVCQKTM